MFTFQRSTIRTLSDAGFTIDCSLLPGVYGTHEATGDFVLADNTRRPDPFPYRPDVDDPWSPGRASVVELPVSANLGDGDIKGQLAALRARVDRRFDVDVFQSYWHHFEFVHPGWKGTFAGVTTFLMECAKLPNVVFSTAADAAAAMEAAGL
jgi:hypothetical protein